MDAILLPLITTGGMCAELASSLRKRLIIINDNNKIRSYGTLTSLLKHI